MGKNYESSNSFRRAVNEETLEISSTGYGFETVIKEKSPSQLTEEEVKNNGPACGGL